MAKISNKSLEDLSSWNPKELRKLKILCKNRIASLKKNPNAEIRDKDILYNKDEKSLEELVLQIGRAEKLLARG